MEFAISLLAMLLREVQVEENLDFWNDEFGVEN